MEEHPQLNSLPLDWTRVQRVQKRKRRDLSKGTSDHETTTTITTATTKRNSNDNDNLWDDDDDNTNNDACVCCPSSSSSIHTLMFQDIIQQPSASHFNMTNNQWNLHGRVIFCIPDPNDCDWFQGYYFPFPDHSSIGSKEDYYYYYGILCTCTPLEEMDECLQCAMGGYRIIREMTLTRMISKTKHKSNNLDNNNEMTTTNKKQLTPTNTTTLPHVPPQQMIASMITWLGGDMMHLSMKHKKTKDPTIGKDHNTTSNQHKQVQQLLMKTTTFHTTTNATTTARSSRSDIFVETEESDCSNATLSSIRATTTAIRDRGDEIPKATQPVYYYTQQYFSSLLRNLISVTNSSSSNVDKDENNGEEKVDHDQQQQQLSNSTSTRPSSPTVSSTYNSEVIMHHKCLIDELMPNVAIIIGTMDISV